MALPKVQEKREQQPAVSSNAISSPKTAGTRRDITPRKTGVKRDGRHW
jgi:hypothetical protein